MTLRHTVIILLLIFACRSSEVIASEYNIFTLRDVSVKDPVKAFADPPVYARPRVFWWWLNSMVTFGSITRDLEELKDKGFGGAMIFDAGSSNYNVANKTEHGPDFGSKKWRALFAHALKEADRLGLELSLNIQSGWNPGGPSVKPVDAMKKIVWTEKKVTGPIRFSGLLPMAQGRNYRDIAVQAFKLIKRSPAGNRKKFRVTASSYQDTNRPELAVDTAENTWWVSRDPPSKIDPQWLQFEYDKPVEISAFYILGRKDYGPRIFELLYSQDGKTYVSIDKYHLDNEKPSALFSFPEIKAKFFRLFITASYDRGKATDLPRNVQVDTMALGKGVGFHIPRKRSIKYWGYKSLKLQFHGWGDYPLYYLREQDPSSPFDADLKSDSVLNLTNKLTGDGCLTWDVPEGEWVIARYGYVLTGARVSTCSDGWGGLSFDHLSTRALEDYLSSVVDPILKSGGDLVGRSLKYLHTDSWEMGLANWTGLFSEEFKRFRGYDMMRYLPVLTDRIVDSREISNRFLRDYRLTVSDCIAKRMYAEFADYAHKHNLLVHPESGGPHSAPIEALKCLGINDVPMGEFWARANTHRVSEGARLFIKQSASAAHIYGKRFVAGEGPTSIGPQWERAPRDLKSVFDRNLCSGINRFFWHCFTSSPKKFGLPGNEYFAGTHLNPNTTWWSKCWGWTDYLSRCSFLLGEGLFQADVCIYYGEDSPNFVSRKQEIKGLGPGYDYDVCNADVILNRMSVEDGCIILPDGMRYRVLVLPGDDAISLEVLQKISELVWAGATLSGPRPLKAISLRDYPACDKEIAKIAEKLYGRCDGKNIFENRYGKGRVFWGKSLRDILISDGIGPDFEFKSSQEKAQVDYIHRRAGDMDIYLVVNRLARHGIYDAKYRYMTDLPDRYEEMECSFRVQDKVPELWNPMSGIVTDEAVYREEGGRMVVPLRLAPEGSVFVVFRKRLGQGKVVVMKKEKKPKRGHVVSVQKDGVSLFPISKHKVGKWPAFKVNRRSGKRIMLEAFKPGVYDISSSLGKTARIKINRIPGAIDIKPPWSVSFPGGWGAPGKTEFPALVSWTDCSDPGIKYFSGTAAYRNEFVVTGNLAHEKPVYLDLGNVLELASVRLNGRELGIVWIAPFRLDIAGAIKKGRNLLEVEVTNLWPNRLIGDQFLPPEKRYTKTNVKKFTKKSPLRKSGLLGPVRIVFPETQEIDL